ncbi:hypothetical protein [Spiroplasma endosymbiont of Aspidapion aeneum]|uniref:hypothetical protein n=1 Tax=Spiroplasma endosymbiont of Aspidapion aeneum TaxID=3066276 RepID=UPI00313D9E8C
MDDEKILTIIKNTVYLIPGVKGFADYKATPKDELSTKDVVRSVEFNVKNDNNHLMIHLILLNGFNMKNVLREVQYRIKFELEKASEYTRSYIVDLVVDDIINE